MRRKLDIMDNNENFIDLGEYQAIHFLKHSDRSHSISSCTNAFNEFFDAYHVCKRFREFLARNEYPTMKQILIDEVLTEPKPIIKTCEKCGHSKEIKK